ncbi:HAMP domain-containing sensor histidine kinase [Tibeticola sp.]|jgi:two-component system sensor histidine kinase PilS (NtrC family)|uniref:ATP-binding protein n=1 Tax=Tibeticola sp. TaxID=2005368 RepID=UPI002588B9E0|nr:HAMP domain-containing sensor histidine kinase [Tibeticola sp.]MCI4441024.1 HAMP domain-containing histidine kinase [Tibeticola sp.]
MDSQAPSTWFGSTLATAPNPASPAALSPSIWNALMSARILVGAVWLLLAAMAISLGQGNGALLLGSGAFYFVAALVWRLRGRAQARRLDPRGTLLIGFDVLALAFLHLTQRSHLDLTPLFALPVLTAGILGSRRLALGTAAAVSLLLLAEAGWNLLQPLGRESAFLGPVQAGLTGTGLFIVALFTQQLTRRLTRQEAAARRSAEQAALQTEVNSFIIERLAHGVLVVDPQLEVQAANPVAAQLLDFEHAAQAHRRFNLASRASWLPLAVQVERMFMAADTSERSEAEVELADLGAEPARVQAQLRLASVGAGGGQRLCVVLLHDLRALEARLRQEKLSVLGRMSASVAHEIRNPLAAIVQANALLEETLTADQARQLTRMIRQNAERIAQTVDDVLDVARVEHHRSGPLRDTVPLEPLVRTIVGDWQSTQGTGRLVDCTLDPNPSVVAFTEAHLRRVLTNLLDNARRYAARGSRIQVASGRRSDARAWLLVWSSGPPLDAAIERRLFEPFSSSDRRSSGLGLYICRELCARHGAQIDYERCPSPAGTSAEPGNGFRILFAPIPAAL